MTDNLHRNKQSVEKVRSPNTKKRKDKNGALEQAQEEGVIIPALY
jgi:hypothetical protein